MSSTLSLWLQGQVFPRTSLKQMVKIDFLFMYFPALSHLYFQTLHAGSHPGDCWMETPGRGYQQLLSTGDLHDFPESRLSWTHNVTPWSQFPAWPAGHGGPETVAPEDEAVPGAQARPQPDHGGEGVLQEAALTKLRVWGGVSEAAVVYGQHFVSMPLIIDNRASCMDLILILVHVHFCLHYIPRRVLYSPILW